MNYEAHIFAICASALGILLIIGLPVMVAVIGVTSGNQETTNQPPVAKK